MNEKGTPISRDEVEVLLSSIRSFFRSIPFDSLHSIPHDCETLMDLMDYYKIPLGCIIEYILPALGYVNLIEEENCEKKL